MSTQQPDEDVTRRDAQDEAEVQRLLVNAGARPPVPAGDIEQIRAAVREAWRAQLASRRAPPRAWIAALAATLALAVGAAWWWGSGEGSGPAETLVAQVEAVRGGVELAAAGADAVTPEVGRRLVAGATLVTSEEAGGRPGRVALRLAGGALLRVDAGSSVRLLGPARVALDVGAVYVDSGPAGRAGRIEVHTPLGEVRELGTQFAVRLLRSAGGPSLRVRVREGAVAATHAGRSHQAGPGQELTLRSDGSVDLRAVAGWDPGWAWVLAAGPGFSSEGRTLAELLDWVSRETGWRIELADAAARGAGTIVLHGDLGALPADRAAFAVLPGAGLEGKLEGGTLVIRARR
jgi:hypothetical protein